jgi:exosome complex protein LRP1
VRNISSQLEGVRAHLKPLLQLPIQTTLTKMPPIERARLQVAVGFAVNALMFIYLKTKGENPSEHPVKKELDRVRAYLKKMKSAEASIKEAARKNDVRERHGLPTNASIAFVDTSVARRTVERTLGIKRKQKCSDAQAQVEKSDRESSSSSSSSSSNASSAKKAKRTSKTIKPKVSQKKKKKR